MAAKDKPEGYYSRDGKDFLVIDPTKLSDTGEILMKDADAATWSDAVAYRECVAGSALLIRDVKDFSAKFKRTTAENVMFRTREREAAESAALAKEQGDEAATGEEPLELDEKA